MSKSLCLCLSVFSPFSHHNVKEGCLEVVAHDRVSEVVVTKLTMKPLESKKKKRGKIEGEMGKSRDTGLE